MMDIFNFFLENSSLCILAFFGFLAFYKGVPFLIKRNEERHDMAEKKLDEIEDKLKHSIAELEKKLESVKKHDYNNSKMQVDMLLKIQEELDEISQKK